jgi:hypothetical protein
MQSFPHSSLSSEQVSAAVIYQQFILNLVTQQQVMALINAEQHWAWSGQLGNEALNLWHHPNLIKPVIHHWVGYRIFPISLEELIFKVIPVLEREKKQIALNLAENGQNVLVPAKQLLIDLKNYLYELERLNPSHFKELDLPSPRKIRLH